MKEQYIYIYIYHTAETIYKLNCKPKCILGDSTSSGEYMIKEYNTKVIRKP